MNENIKWKIKAKNKLYQVFFNRARQEIKLCALEEPVRNLHDLILQTKTSFYKNLEKKPNDSTLPSKTYWSILKGFYNDKRVPVIPPLLISNKFMIDFKTKVVIFDLYFCFKNFGKQCTPLANGNRELKWIYLAVTGLIYYIWLSTRIKYKFFVF